MTTGYGETTSKLAKEFYQRSTKYLQKTIERLKQLNDLTDSGKLNLNDLDSAAALKVDLENAI